MTLTDAQKGRINFIINRLIEKQLRVSDKEIYSSITQHLRAVGEEVDSVIASELEKMIQSGEIVEYRITPPGDERILNMLYERKVPNKFYIKGIDKDTLDNLEKP